MVAMSPSASTAMPANSAYALIGISGESAMAKSTVEVVALAVRMACRQAHLAC